MNNEQNNGVGNITPIMPNNANNQNTNPGVNNEQSGVTTPTPITPITPTTPEQQNNQVPNNNPTIPITPMPEVRGTSNQNVENQNNQVNPTPTITPQPQQITPTIVMPESKDSSMSAPQQPISNAPKDLKLESSSPFDIGVSAPLSTAINITTPQTPISQPTQSSTITPIPVTNNNNDTENKPQQDINIKEPTTQSTDNVVSVGTYLIHIILFSIPVIGLILLIVKALDKKNKNLSNFAKAQLILAIIATVIMVVIFVLFGAVIFNSIGNASSTDTTYTVDYNY